MAGIKYTPVPVIPAPAPNPVAEDSARLRAYIVKKYLDDPSALSGFANSTPAPDPQIDILPHPGTAVSMPLGTGQEGDPSEPVVKPPPFAGRPTPAAAPGYGPGMDDAAMVDAQAAQAAHHRNADMYRGASLISRGFGGHMDESAARAQDAQADEPVKNVIQRRVQADEELKRQEAQRKADETRSHADAQSPDSVAARNWFRGTGVGKRLVGAIGEDAYNALPADQIPALKDLIKDDTSMEKLRNSTLRGGLPPELATIQAISQMFGREGREVEQHQSNDIKVQKANVFNPIQSKMADAKAASVGLQQNRQTMQVGERAVPGTKIINNKVFDRPQTADAEKNYMANVATYERNLSALEAIVNRGPIDRLLPGSTDYMKAQEYWGKLTGERNLLARLGQMTTGHQELLKAIQKNPNDLGALLNNSGYASLLADMHKANAADQEDYLRAHNRLPEQNGSGLNTFPDDDDVTADGASPHVDVPTMPLPPPAGAEKVGEAPPGAAPFRVEIPPGATKIRMEVTNPKTGARTIVNVPVDKVQETLQAPYNGKQVK